MLCSEHISLSPQQGEELLRQKLQIKPGLIEEKQEKL